MERDIGYARVNREAQDFQLQLNTLIVWQLDRPPIPKASPKVFFAQKCTKTTPCPLTWFAKRSKFSARPFISMLLYIKK